MLKNILREVKMAKLIIRPKEGKDLKMLISSAISEKIKRLEIGLKRTAEKFKVFESRYGISTDEFIKTWTSEDLKGKDTEYVDWYGEYEIFRRLKDALEILKDVEYVD